MGEAGTASVFRRRSVTLVRVLGVYDFDVGEREETPPTVHLPLPLAADVHPGDLDDVPDLRRKDRRWSLETDRRGNPQGHMMKCRGQTETMICQNEFRGHVGVTTM